MAKKKNRPRQKAEPGRQVMPEDRPIATGTFTLKKGGRRVPGPVATDTGVFTVEEVETRLMRAMKTLRAMPDRERRFFGMKSGMPEHVQDQIDAYASVEVLAPRFRPSPFDVSDYLRALSWARHLQRSQWQFLWWRSFDFSFGLMAKYTGQSDETARRRYREALTDAWVAANGIIPD